MESSSLEQLHAVQLDMLVKFDRICAENGLVYFLDSGTALGAVRHGGFIPWDDDVDVAMPRADYDKLLEIGSRGLPDQLFLQTCETDPAYMMPFAKIRLGNTFFPEPVKDYDKLKYRGIYIDVFPFDRVPADAGEAGRAIRKSRFWYFVSVFSRRAYPGKKIPQKVVSSVLHRMPDRIVHKLHKRYERFCTQYQASGSPWMTCFCWRMSQRGEYLFAESELLPAKEVRFEGKTLRIMADPHSYLTKMYGDYMTLPPEDKRRSHLNGAFQL